MNVLHGFSRGRSATDSDSELLRAAQLQAGELPEEQHEENLQQAYAEETAMQTGLQELMQKMQQLIEDSAKMQQEIAELRGGQKEMQAHMRHQQRLCEESSKQNSRASSNRQASREDDERSNDSRFNTAREMPQTRAKPSKTVDFYDLSEDEATEAEAEYAQTNEWVKRDRLKDQSLYTFEGKEPRRWIACIEEYCDEWGIPENKRYSVARTLLHPKITEAWTHKRKVEGKTRTWKNLQQFVTNRYGITSLAIARERLRKVKWKGSAETLKQDILDAVESCREVQDAELIDQFLGRLPVELRRQYTGLRLKTKVFLEVAEVVIELHEADRLGEMAANSIKQAEREGDDRNGRRDSKDDFRSSRGRLEQSNKKGANNRGFSRNRNAGSRAAGDRPFKLSPCRNCGGTGHLSRDCANLKGTKAPPHTQCFECGGKGHYKRECVPYKGFKEGVSNNAAAAKTSSQRSSAPQVKAEQDAAKNSSAKGNLGAMCGELCMGADSGHLIKSMLREKELSGKTTDTQLASSGGLANLEELHEQEQRKRDMEALRAELLQTVAELPPSEEWEDDLPHLDEWGKEAEMGELGCLQVQAEHSSETDSFCSDDSFDSPQQRGARPAHLQEQQEQLAHTREQQQTAPLERAQGFLSQPECAQAEAQQLAQPAPASEQQQEQQTLVRTREQQQIAALKREQGFLSQPVCAQAVAQQLAKPALATEQQSVQLRRKPEQHKQQQKQQQNSPQKRGQPAKEPQRCSDFLWKRPRVQIPLLASVPDTQLRADALERAQRIMNQPVAQLPSLPQQHEPQQHESYQLSGQLPSPLQHVPLQPPDASLDEYSPVHSPQQYTSGCRLKPKTQTPSQEGQSRAKLQKEVGAQKLRALNETLGARGAETLGSGEEANQSEESGEEANESAAAQGAALARRQSRAIEDDQPAGQLGSKTTARDSQCRESRRMEFPAAARRTKLDDGLGETTPERQSCTSSASSTHKAANDTGPFELQQQTPGSQDPEESGQLTPEAQLASEEVKGQQQGACATTEADSLNATAGSQRSGSFATLQALASLWNSLAPEAREQEGQASLREKQSLDSSISADGLYTRATSAQSTCPEAPCSTQQCGQYSRTSYRGPYQSSPPFRDPPSAEPAESLEDKALEDANYSRTLCTTSGWPRHMLDSQTAVQPFSAAVYAPSGGVQAWQGTPFPLLSAAHLESALALPQQQQSTTAPQHWGLLPTQQALYGGAAGYYVGYGIPPYLGCPGGWWYGPYTATGPAYQVPNSQAAPLSAPHQRSGDQARKRSRSASPSQLLNEGQEPPDGGSWALTPQQQQETQPQGAQQGAAKRRQAAPQAVLGMAAVLYLVLPEEGPQAEAEKQQLLQEVAEELEEVQPPASFALAKQKQLHFAENQPFSKKNSSFCEKAPESEPLVFVQVEVQGRPVQALIDTGSTHSLIAADLCDDLQISTEKLAGTIDITLGNGRHMRVDRGVWGLRCQAGPLSFRLNALVGPIAFDMILGLPFLCKERVFWRFSPLGLTVFRAQQRLEIPVSREPADLYPVEWGPHSSIRADNQQAHEVFIKGLNDLTKEEAAGMVRKSPKKYKNFKTAASRALVRQLVQLARDEAEQRWAKSANTNGSKEVPVCAAGQGRAPKLKKSPFDEPTPEELEQLTEEMQAVQITPLRVPARVDFEAQVKHQPTYEKFDAAAKEWETTMDARFLNMLKNYRDMFPDSLPPGLPARRCIDHTIPTQPGVLPPKGPIYNMDIKTKLALKAELLKLAEKGIITHTPSPYGAPCMMVPKKADAAGGEKQYRMVINYKALNDITISAEAPIPNITTIMEQLHGAKYFTIMDMESGFHQVRVAPEDQHKTAFRSCYGQFEFKVMPFGLKGAPGTFQTIMHDILMEHVAVRCAIYLDDVLVYSPTLEAHIQDVAMVLSALRKHQMFPKFTKCRFARTQLEYLGYSIGADGIKPSMDKIKDVLLWPEQLKDVGQVQQFLGLVGFVRIFMGTRFADMAKPLTDLIKKGVKFEWRPEHTAAIQQLKRRLVDYTVLQIPDPAKPYTLWTDASGHSLGAVLLQDGKPLGFISKKMKEHELRYSTYQQELLALLTALKKWEHLLRPAKVTAFTDHRALQHLLSSKAADVPTGRMARWLRYLAEFPNITITYRPGRENQAADCLSRNPAHQQQPTLSLMFVKEAAADSNSNCSCAQGVCAAMTRTGRVVRVAPRAQQWVEQQQRRASRTPAEQNRQQRNSSGRPPPNGRRRQQEEEQQEGSPPPAGRRRLPSAEQQEGLSPCDGWRRQRSEERQGGSPSLNGRRQQQNEQRQRSTSRPSVERQQQIPAEQDDSQGRQHNIPLTFRDLEHEGIRGPVHVHVPPAVQELLPDGPQQLADVCGLQQAQLEPAPVVGSAEWRVALKHCPVYGEIYRECRKNPDTLIEGRAKSHPGAARSPPLRLYMFSEGTGTLCVNTRGGWRIVVPNVLAARMNLLYEFHDHPTAGHVGVKSTFRALASIFYWEGMLEFTETYVRTCLKCQTAKAVTQKPAGLLQSLKIPTTRWEHLSMDFITSLPKTAAGNDAILVVVDRLSKMAHFIPVQETISAAKLSKVFEREVVRLHGVPRSIVTDRDPKFISDFWAKFTAKLGIKRCLSTAYHPQTDGQTERTNQTIERLLRTYLQADQTKWEDLLPALELAYNIAPNASTGLSPFQVVIGENPRTGKTYELYAHYETPPMHKTFRMMVARAVKGIIDAQRQQARYANAHRRDVQFEVGDKVFLSTQNLNIDGCPKFKQRFVGPYEITQKISPVAYRLDLPPSWQIHKVFHVSLLRPYYSDPEFERPQELWEPVIRESGPEYEVEAILDIRGSGRQREYLVQWKGRPPSGATWEPLENLTNCKRLLRAFHYAVHRAQRNAARPERGPTAAVLQQVRTLFIPSSRGSTAARVTKDPTTAALEQVRNLFTPSLGASAAERVDSPTAALRQVRTLFTPSLNLLGGGIRSRDSTLPRATLRELLQSRSSSLQQQQQSQQQQRRRVTFVESEREEVEPEAICAEREHDKAFAELEQHIADLEWQAEVERKRKAELERQEELRRRVIFGNEPGPEVFRHTEYDIETGEPIRRVGPVVFSGDRAMLHFPGAGPSATPPVSTTPRSHQSVSVSNRIVRFKRDEDWQRDLTRRSTRLIYQQYKQQYQRPLPQQNRSVFQQQPSAASYSRKYTQQRR